MKFNLRRFGYKLMPEYRLWISSRVDNCGPRDQSELYLRLENAINHSDDLSLFAPDLKKHQVDWPSFYHLSSCRANILRPLDDKLPNATILEIGAGCGAISRYLGEAGAHALCLEPNLNHAILASKRTSDLPNVSIVNDTLGNFDCEYKFDLVTLICPLESPNFFCAWEMPFDKLLIKARSFLKPDGLVVIAVDNKIGLKYLAGAPDSQNGIRGYGLEGREDISNRANFGRMELKKLLGDAGFNYSRFLLPFPSYTAPVSILTERGLNDPDFDFGILAGMSADSDRQLPDSLAFNLQLAWPVISRHKLCLDLANAFLIVASQNPQSPLCDNVLAFHYNSNRSGCFCKQTIFVRNSKNEISVRYERLSSVSVHAGAAPTVSMRIPEEADYICGKVFGICFSRIIGTPEWSIDALVEQLTKLLTFIGLNFSNIDDISPHNLKEYELDGSYFDVIPNNIIVAPNGTFHQIDKEWHLEHPIPVGWYLFRVLLSVVNSAPIIEQPRWQHQLTRLELFREIFHQLGVIVSDEDILAFGSQEAKIQSFILDSIVPDDFWRPYHLLNKNCSVFMKLAKLSSDLQLQKDIIASSEEAIGSNIRQITWAKELELQLTQRLCDLESKNLASEANIKSLLEQIEIATTMLHEAKYAQNSLYSENVKLSEELQSTTSLISDLESIIVQNKADESKLLSEIDAIRDELTRKLSLVSELESVVAQDKLLTSNLQSEYQILQEALKISERSANHWQEQVYALNNTVTTLSDQILDTQSTKEILSSKLAETSWQLSILEQQLNGLLKSRSWRITAPLRLIKSFFPRRVA